MSNLSDIGFSVQTQEEFTVLLERAYEGGQKLEVADGFYVRYADLSGAELWLQFDQNHELIGMNPYFRGSSRIFVGLNEMISRKQSLLDGGWIGWPNPSSPEDPESGDFPLVFDAPDFLLSSVNTPGTYPVQLTAFSQDLTIFDTEENFTAAQASEEIPFATKSFIPVGLIGRTAEEAPEAQVLLTGIVVDFEERKNQFSGQIFYWISLETLNVTIDLVADHSSFPSGPQTGSVIQCQAWLSGRILLDAAPPLS